VASRPAVSGAQKRCNVGADDLGGGDADV
jgi:hypothetical protein